GVTALAGAHHAIAGLEGALRLGAHFDHFARPVEPDGVTGCAMAAMPARGGKVGAVEARGFHLHQDLVRLRLWLRDVPHFEAILGGDSGEHWLPPFLSVEAPYSGNAPGCASRGR